MSAYFIYCCLTTSPFRLFHVTQFLVSCPLFYYLVSLNSAVGTLQHQMMLSIFLHFIREEEKISCKVLEPEKRITCTGGPGPCCTKVITWVPIQNLRKRCRYICSCVHASAGWCGGNTIASQAKGPGSNLVGCKSASYQAVIWYSFGW